MNPDLRVVYTVPRRPSWRFRIRQVLYALVRIQVSESKPSIYVLNRADVPRRLFTVPDCNDVQERAREVAADLELLGLIAFCDRYRVPSEFLDATEVPRRRIPVLHPLL
jgi:hypothetical protein